MNYWSLDKRTTLDNMKRAYYSTDKSCPKYN